MTTGCRFEVVFVETEYTFGIASSDYFAPALDQLREAAGDGPVIIEPDRLRVTDIGRYFVRNIALPFDCFHQAFATGAPSCSRTIRHVVDRSIIET